MAQVKPTAALALIALLAAGAGLTACQEDEQGRVLLYDKGTYLGEPDPPLEEQRVRELRGRARQQAGL